MPASARERILEATYACVARYGLAKTTIEDAAREAALSRATIYRYFPGGRDELLAEVIGWEARRFFVRLAAAVAGTDSLASMLEEALVFAHRAVEEHAVLQKILETEPDRLLPTLTVESDRIRHYVSTFLLPHLAAAGADPAAPPAADPAAPPAADPAAAADFLARMVLSYIASPGRWDLRDRPQVASLVQTELLGGLRGGASR